MDRYTLRVKGLTPLLMHRNPMIDDEEVVLSGGKKGDDRYPPDKWKSYLYLEGGRIVMPEANIKAAIEKAGAAISTGGRKSLKSAAVAGVYFDDPFISLLVGEEAREVSEEDIRSISGEFNAQKGAVRDLGFDIDVRPASIGKAKHVRCRPRFNLWSFEASFEVVLEELTAKRLVELFARAGRLVGLCDWRPASPGRPGSFGRFTTEVVEEAKEKAA